MALFPPPRLRVIGLLFALFITASAFADDPWDGAPFSADPKALVAAAEKVPAGDSAMVVLLDEASYSFETGGHTRTIWRRVYRIVDESAIEEMGTVEVPWAPWYNDRPSVAARVVSNEGTVHLLDSKAVIEAPAREELGIFSDNRVLRAPLPGIAVGSVVEYLIAFNGNNPIADAGSAEIVLFGGYAPTQHTRLTIDGPASLDPRVVNKTNVQPKTEEKNGRRILTFDSGRIEARKSPESYLPFDTIAAPYVAFSTGSSWQNLAKRYSDIVDKQIAGNDLKKFVRDAIGNATDKQEIVARALAAIEKNVRYAGVEVGESSIIPRAPRIVLGNKYGDCKDKATLLVAMLREAGIPASVVLIRAGSDFDIIPDLPGVGRFNHAIVRVEGEAPMWVDPTDDFAHAGHLPAQDQGRMVLIASPATTELTRTPESPTGANRYSETRVYTLPEEGKARVTEITETTAGPEDAFQRRFYAESDRTKYREQIELYVKSYYAAKKLEKIDATDPHDLTKPFRVTIEASDAETGEARAGEAAVAFHPASLINWVPLDLRDYDDEHPEEAAKKKRLHDFVFPNPGLRQWTYRVIPPAGYASRTLPQNDTTKLGTMILTREFASQPDGSVTATLRFDTGKRRITAVEFEETRAALKKYLGGKPTILGFDLVGQAKLNAGDVTGALGEFRKLADLHPKEAQHHIELARALLTGGLGDAARVEARRAVEMEPANARAHFALAGILEYDLLGRILRKGFDMPGALASLRKAKELDPKSAEYRGALAKLLSYGGNGLEFGRDAHLAESIAEFQAITKDLSEKEAKPYADDLMLVLAHAGRFAEMKELAKTIDDPQQKEVGRITAIAATDGTAAALHELGAFDANTRRTYTTGVAQTLFKLRLYPQATELFDAATQGGQNASSARPFIEALRKTRRLETLPIDESDPKSAVQKMMRAIGDESDKAAIRKVLSADIPDDDKTFDAVGFLRHFAPTDQMPPAVVADLAYGTIRLQTDGSEKGGFRIRARSDMDNSQQTFYVVREKGSWVIRALGVAPELIGDAVLRYADAGDLETARTWLNWTREDISAGGGDDPLRGPSFPLLWPKDNPSTNADEIRTAAATLMMRKGLDRGVPVLVAAHERLKDEKSKLWIDAALAGAYEARSDWKNAVTVTERLFNGYPDSEIAFLSYASALSRSGRTADAEAVAKKRLEKKPKDEDALRILSMNATRSRDYAAAAKYAEKLVDELTPDANDYNNAAWYELFTGNLDHALENARRATSEESTSSAAALHTLATAYAETGKNIEARDALLRTLEKSRRDLPESSDWYVLGRMAENYGVRDAALAAYKRVDDKDDGGATAWELAQRRLAVLAVKK
jgi:tetratricopeptide (TPR) repeat protein